jgi:hypothetical protein
MVRAWRRLGGDEEEFKGMKAVRRSLVWASLAVCLAVIALSAGCEWTSGGGTEDWNNRYNFLNFSGVYRGLGGGLLVTKYTTGGTAGIPGSTNTVTGETIATGNGSSTTFAGSLKNKPVIAGSLTIAAASYQFSDPDGDGVLTGTSGASGSINYGTGQWSLTFNGVAIDSGTPIVASYQFVRQGTPATAGDVKGSSGKAISSFAVEHIGNVVNIVDNNGASYGGNLGDIRGTGGANQDSVGTTPPSVPLAGEEFIASFEAEGVSSAGMRVHMVGTFQGTVQSVREPTEDLSGALVLGARVMFGTWIEDGGVTGDIQGEASPISSVLTTPVP